jgi:hypothetical protein
MFIWICFVFYICTVTCSGVFSTSIYVLHTCTNVRTVQILTFPKCKQITILFLTQIWQLKIHHCMLQCIYKYTPRDRLIVVSCEQGGNMMTYLLPVTFSVCCRLCQENHFINGSSSIIEA